MIMYQTCLNEKVFCYVGLFMKFLSLKTRMKEKVRHQHDIKDRKRTNSQINSISRNIEPSYKKPKLISLEVVVNKDKLNEISQTSDVKIFEQSLSQSRIFDDETLSSIESFISRQDIRNQRIIPSNRFLNESFMKNYSRGEPSLTLYVKNLSKDISEKDLRQLFGTYCDDPKFSER